MARPLTLLVLVALGCNRPAPAIDRSGIISMVPSATEIVFALGAGDQLVGVSDFCEHPEEAMRLPRYGGFLNPSTERIVTSGARAVVLVSTARKLARACREAGMEVVTVRTNNLEDMDESIEALGRLTGMQDEARDLRARIHSELDAAGASVRSGSAPRVAVIVDRAPDALKRIFVAGPGSLLDDLLRKLGASNAFSDATRMYPMVSLETVLLREPDVILDLRPLHRDGAGSLEKAEALWRASGVPAPGGTVERVHVLEATDFTVYGPRLGRAARRLAAVIHGGEP